MFNVMIIRKIDGKTVPEWLADAEGFAVEFQSEEHARAQFELMKKSDSTIIDFVIE